MRASSFALLAFLGLGSTLVGCSGFQPFWQPSSQETAAAKRSVEGPIALARLAEQRGKTLEAERLYRSILEKSPDNPVIYHRLAIIQSQKGRFEEANAYFDQALRLKSDDPTLICDAGYCQYLQQRGDMAESLFRRALDMDPHHEASMNNLALVLGERGDDRGAFALFRRAGSEAKAHVNMGFVYTRRGELAKAKDAYNRALSLDPNMITAAEAMVQLTQFEKQAKRAVAYSSRPNANRVEYREVAEEVAYAPQGHVALPPRPRAMPPVSEPGFDADAAPIPSDVAQQDVAQLYRDGADWAEYNTAIELATEAVEIQTTPAVEPVATWTGYNRPSPEPEVAEMPQTTRLPETAVPAESWEGSIAPLPPPMPGGFSAPMPEAMPETRDGSASAPLPPSMPSWNAGSDETLMEVPQTNTFGWHVEQER